VYRQTPFLYWDFHVKVKVKVRGLEWPRGFQEIRVPRFHENGTGWW
jgi:hypothetical protein